VRVQLVPSSTTEGAIDIRLYVEGGLQGLISAVPREQIWTEQVGILHEPKEQGVTLSKKRIRRLSAKQERRVAEALGGRAQRGSGSRIGYKGDGRVYGRFRIENKLTFADSYRVTLSDLHKIRSECAGRETPVFEVEFRERNGAVRDAWVLVPHKDWERLVKNAPADDR
jgi:hypothetical protein